MNTYRHSVVSTSIVLAVVVCVVLLVMIPQMTRYRHRLNQAHIDDRDSEALRVVAKVGDKPVEETKGANKNVMPLLSTLPSVSGNRTTEIRRLGETTMERPTAHEAETIEREARLEAVRQRRRDAARRRLILAITLAVVGIAGVVCAFIAPSTTLVIVAGACAVVGFAGLTAVLILGRRAVLAGQRNDAHLMSATSTVPEVSDEAPAEPEVQEDIAVDQQVEDEEPQQIEDKGSAWTPKPVPAPLYTTKARVEREAPQPLPAELGGGVVPVASSSKVDVVGVLDDVRIETLGSLRMGPDMPDASVESEEPAKNTTMDLDEILARRRASGE